MHLFNKSILLGAVCLAVTACDPNAAQPEKATPSADEQSEAQARSGRTIAFKLAQDEQNTCPFLIGTCLADTRLCLDQEDDGVCGPSFDNCREQMFAKGCESDSKIDIGLNSTLRCWNQFEVCAQSDSDDATCAAALGACVAKGSLCEINAESECDAQVCDAEGCDEVRWNGDWWPKSSWKSKWYPKSKWKPKWYPKAGGSSSWYPKSNGSSSWYPNNGSNWYPKSDPWGGGGG